MSAPSTTTFYQRENNAVSTLLSSLAQGATSATLASGGGALFPSSGTWLVTIWDNTTYPANPSGDPNMEVVLVTSRSSDTLTITRAQSGTSDVIHAAGSYVGLLIMDEALDQHETAINDLETASYRTGWVAMGVTLTYSSVDDPTGVVTSSADISSILSVGMRIKFTNNAATVYGIVTAISGTTITFLHEIDPTDSLALNLMQNSAITAPFFSYQKTPYGFPADERKWTVKVTDTSSRSQSSPSAGVWYNLGTVSMNVPIGAWELKYSVILEQLTSTSTDQDFSYASLSTANNSQGVAESTSAIHSGGASGNLKLAANLSRSIFISLSSKTTYYLNSMAAAAITTLLNRGDAGTTYIRAKSVYL